MASAILTVTTPVADESPAGRRSFFKRLIDAFIEARLRAAMREIARHRHLIPQDDTRRGRYLAAVTDDGALPFGR